MLSTCPVFFGLGWEAVGSLVVITGRGCGFEGSLSSPEEISITELSLAFQRDVDEIRLVGDPEPEDAAANFLVGGSSSSLSLSGIETRLLGPFSGSLRSSTGLSSLNPESESASPKISCCRTFRAARATSKDLRGPQSVCCEPSKNGIQMTY